MSCETARCMQICERCPGLSNMIYQQTIHKTRLNADGMSSFKNCIAVHT